MKTALIIDVDGQLCIQDDWETVYTRPYRNRYVWPTGLRTNDYPEFVGLPCYDGSSYSASYTLGNGLRTRIELPQGKQTPCLRIDEEPLKPPRGGPWEYAWGEWVNQKTGKRKKA